MKTNKKWVLYNKNLNLYYASIYHVGFGPGNKKVYQVNLTDKLDRAFIKTKQDIYNKIKYLKRYHLVDSDNKEFFIDDLIFQQVEITYKILP